MAIPEYLVRMARRAAPKLADNFVVIGSTPVLSFGDPRSAEVATLGINPSASEFCGGDGWLTLYRGATYEDRGDFSGMYSFVPCRRADDDRARFQRPRISLACVNPESWRVPSGASKPVPEHLVREQWLRVREKVLAWGCLQGVWFRTPPSLRS